MFVYGEGPAHPWAVLFAKHEVKLLGSKHIEIMCRNKEKVFTIILRKERSYTYMYRHKIPPTFNE
jgi:hypothetical protein